MVPTVATIANGVQTEDGRFGVSLPGWSLLRPVCPTQPVQYGHRMSLVKFHEARDNLRLRITPGCWLIVVRWHLTIP